MALFLSLAERAILRAEYQAPNFETSETTKNADPYHPQSFDPYPD